MVRTGSKAMVRTGSKAMVRTGSKAMVRTGSKAMVRTGSKAMVRTVSMAMVRNLMPGSPTKLSALKRHLSIHGAHTAHLTKPFQRILGNQQIVKNSKVHTWGTGQMSNIYMAVHSLIFIHHVPSSPSLWNPMSGIF